MFVVTGGGSGIGRALAQTLALRGKEVLIVGRRPEPLEETAALSSQISIFPADITTHSGRTALISFLKEVKPLRALIHNAGLIEPIAPLRDIEAQAWEQVIATNLNAPLFITQALLPKLQEGRVLHIGSGVAHFPVMGWAPYCVSKAALYMLTRCFQLESSDTAFASVMPGIIETNMQVVIRNSQGMAEEKQTFFQNLKDEGRLLRPETVALFLSWLLLDVSKELYVSREWDIYDSTHHPSWLIQPHVVPHWE